MREYLYKAKGLDGGDWVIGSLLITDDKQNNPFASKPPKKRYQIVSYFPGDWNMGGWDTVDVDPETIGEYTGFTDKYGTKIFEGDLLVKDNGSQYPLCVDFLHGAFVLTKKNGGRDLLKDIDTHQLKVIGNIHTIDKITIK